MLSLLWLRMHLLAIGPAQEMSVKISFLLVFACNVTDPRLPLCPFRLDGVLLFFFVYYSPSASMSSSWSCRYAQLPFLPLFVMQPPSTFFPGFLFVFTLFGSSTPVLHVFLSLPCRCSQASSLSPPQLLCPCLLAFLSASSSLPALLLWLLLFFRVLLSVLQVYSSFLFASSCSHLPALLLLCPFLFFYLFLCGLQVYSGAASETAFIGKESPGPQAYDQHGSGMGRQVSFTLCLCDLLTGRCTAFCLLYRSLHCPLTFLSQIALP